MTIRSTRLRRAFQFAAGATLALVAAAPASAGPVTFAQYFQSNGALQQWTIATSGTTTTVSASGAVSFNFSGVAGLPFSGPENANFTINATSTTTGNCSNVCAGGDTYTQQGYSGTFSFIDNGGGFAQGSNLLSGTFAVTGAPTVTGAQFSSTVGAGSGSFNASAVVGNLNQLVFTSAYLNFAGQTQEVASWSLSSLAPNFAVGTVTSGTAYPAAGPFHASGSGTFSSSAAPSSTPEPSTWIFMSAGLCALVFIKRRHQTASVTR
jgi:hypothetical protein